MRILEYGPQLFTSSRDTGPAARLRAFLMLLVFALTACGGGGSGQSQPDIKMIYAIGLTGSFAQTGQSACNGAALAADDINKQGGISKGPHKGAKLVVECIDNSQSASASATIANKYVADSGYWTMMGFYSTGEAVAAATVAQRSNLSVIATDVSGSALTESVHNVLVIGPRIQTLGYAWVDFCKSYYGASKIADLSPSYSYIADYRSGRDAALKATPGLTMVSEQTYDDTSTQDFAPFISKIKASGAQCLLLGSYPASQCKITAQARQLGLKIPIVDFTGSGTSTTCVQAAGAAYVGMAFGLTFPFPPPAGSYLEKVSKEFQAKYSQAFTLYPSYSYDSVLAVKCAIEDGASTREDLVNFLPKINCQGTTGPLKFTDNRPGERTLTEVEATAPNVDALEPVAIYTAVDKTATLVKLIAKCADRPTCNFMLGS
jgi:branched-chain amino acid transport system substrate-binding protein